MYLQIHTRKKGDTVYKTTYLAESVRDGKKVKKNYLQNLTGLPDDLIDLIGLYCKTHKKKSFNPNFDEQGGDCIKYDESIQGKSIGGVYVLNKLISEMGIKESLGKDIYQSNIAIFQIMGRVLCQGSRLRLVNVWQETTAATDILKLPKLNEDGLYNNLDWLAENQEKIEDKLFSIRHKKKPIQNIYLYDVTSVYFEGEKNELADFGYNRDKKKGKKQIVVGMLCDDEGYPLSVHVFKGNTSDPKTMYAPLHALKKRFKAKNVVFVGDRGMIKAEAIKDIQEAGWQYITALTKPQIEKLISNGEIALELFEEDLGEIETESHGRLILKRNPSRAVEVSKSRNSKLQNLEKKINLENIYLQEHPKANVEKKVIKMEKLAIKLKIKNWVEIQKAGRKLSMKIDEEKLKEEAELDGCYAIKTNLSKHVANKEYVHEKYKSLSKVEWCFRTMKQSFEEVQPVYVRKEKRTKGHVFICMLGYMIMKYIWENCKELNITEASIYEQLNLIQYRYYIFKNIEIKRLPDKFNETQTKILQQLNINIPKIII